ncbi:hypothetical protein OB07_02586 [Pseudomonas aeruginosa]|nr:hypothetical protein OB07_02586 [Pseudomonas aeruginosa]
MSTSTTQAINFAAKLALFDDRWQSRVIAQMNDYQFKLVKIEGDFVWHSHADTDETFIVLAGRLRIDFRDGAVHLGPGNWQTSRLRLAASLGRLGLQMI